MKFIAQMPWAIIIIACLTLGLAPFYPPHIWTKTVLLFKGSLDSMVDMWDLFFHAVPWILLVIKGINTIWIKLHTQHI